MTRRCSFNSYPIRFYVFADGVFVTRVGAEHSWAAGAKLVAIGNTPVGAAIAMVEPVAERDNDMQIKYHVPQHLAVPEIMDAVGIIDDMASVDYHLVLPGGEESVLTLSPMDEPVEWVDARDADASPLYLSKPGQNYWFEYLENSKTVYFRFTEVL